MRLASFLPGPLPGEGEAVASGVLGLAAGSDMPAGDAGGPGEATGADAERYGGGRSGNSICCILRNVASCSSRCCRCCGVRFSSGTCTPARDDRRDNQGCRLNCDVRNGCFCKNTQIFNVTIKFQ